MRADGSDPRPLTTTGVDGHFLRWTQDSRAVLFRLPRKPAPNAAVALAGGEPQPPAEVAGGAHMSFSPDHSRIMDVVAHKELWVSPLSGGSPEKVFEFDDAGRADRLPRLVARRELVLFDRFRPQGGDIWMMEGFE